MVDIACSYNMSCSTIGMILKSKNKIMEHVRFFVLYVVCLRQRCIRLCWIMNKPEL